VLRELVIELYCVMPDGKECCLTVDNILPHLILNAFNRTFMFAQFTFFTLTLEYSFSATIGTFLHAFILQYIISHPISCLRVWLYNPRRNCIRPNRSICVGTLTSYVHVNAHLVRSHIRVNPPLSRSDQLMGLLPSGVLLRKPLIDCARLLMCT
jgi:hypothetical protein